jgi:hypothetical protein
VEKTETDATPLSVALDFKAMWGQQRVNASGDLEKIARNVNPIAIAIWRRMRLSKDGEQKLSTVAGFLALLWRGGLRHDVADALRISLVSERIPECVT